MKMLRWIVFAFALLLFSFNAILPTHASPADAAIARMQALAASVHSPHVTSLQAQQHTAAWTVLVYMAADNDLESYAIADLNEMEFIGSTENLNIAVQVDRSPQYDSTNGDWSGARRYFMTQDTDLDNIASQDVGDLGVVNMGDPKTLQDFIDWGIKTYPAQHYGLVIWDHGGSWLGVGIDDSANDDALQLPELDSALKGSLADSNVSKFDLVGFDACLMGSIEVYRTLAPYASYAVASPELVPGQGWDYAGAFGAIADDPTVDAPTFGKAIVDSFNTFYTQVVTNYDYFSLGLIDLSQTANVVNALDSFTGTAANAGEAIARARSKALVFGAFDDPQYADIWAATDMLGLMQQVQSQTKDTQIVDASKAVITAGQKLVMYHLSSKTLEDSQGVSIYFPRTSTFFTDKDRDTRYGQDTPSDLSPWQKFLGSFYSFFSRSNPSALITSATSENNQALFKLSFNTGGLADALFYIAVRLDNKPVLVDYRRFDIGDFPSPGPVEPTVTWTKNIPVVSDGTTQVPALLIKDRRNPLRGIINGTFIPQNGDPQIPVQVLFDLTDPNLGKSTTVWGIRDSLIGPMPSEIKVAPGDKFIPAWLSIGANGQINTRSSGTTLTFTTAPLTYFTIDAPQATYDVGVQAISPAGVIAVTTTEAQVSSNGTLTVSQPNPPKENTPEPQQNQPTQQPSTPPPPPAPTSNPSSPSSNPTTVHVGPPAGINPVGSDSVSGQVGSTLPHPFSVQIVDSGGHGVSGQPVTFTAPSSGPSGTFAQSGVYTPNTLDQVMAFLSGANTALAQEQQPTNTVTTTTGSNGVAQSTDFTPNTIAGSYDVTVTLSGGLTVTFHMTNDPGPAAKIVAVSGTPQSARTLDDFTTALQAHVLDAFDNSVPGVTVTFTSPDPDEGAGATFANEETIAQVDTDANGLATAPTITANYYNGGPYTVEAKIDIDEESSVSAYFDLTNLPPFATHFDVVSQPTSTVVGQAFSQGIEIYVYDQDNNPVTSGDITFVGPGTGAGVTFDDAEGNRFISVPIGPDGHAVSGPIHATTTADTYDVYAIIGEEESDPITLTNTPDVAASMDIQAGDNQSAVVGGDFTTDLAVIIKDQYLNPVPGVTVTFANDVDPGANGQFDSDQDSTNVDTGEDGIATAHTLTANHTAGTFTVSASAALGTLTATFNLTNNPGLPNSLTLNAAADRTTEVGTAFDSAAFVATVQDYYGNPVPGIQVHYAAPFGDPTGTFASSGELDTPSPSIETAVITESDGTATPSTFTASTKAGSYDVQVYVDGITPTSCPSDNPLLSCLHLTNEPGPIASVTTVEGTSGQSTPILNYLDTPLAVLVTDEHDNPISGVAVSFTAANGPDAGGQFDLGGESYTEIVSGVTDEDGVYQEGEPFFTNSVAGGYTVTVNTTGYSGLEPVFNLTNLPGPAYRIVGDPDTVNLIVGTTEENFLTAQVQDQYGNGVAGVDVTFTAQASGASGTFADTGTFTSELATSAVGGFAAASDYSANTIAGTYQVTASADGLVSGIINVTNKPDAWAGVAVKSGARQDKELGGNYGSLVAKLVDQYGNEIHTSAVSVTFSVSSSNGAGGTFTGSGTNTESKNTNANGYATSSAFTANQTAGDFTVSASTLIGSNPVFASFLLANVNPQPTIETSGLSPSQYAVGDTTPVSLTITGSGFVNGVSIPRFNGVDIDSANITSITSTQIVVNLVAGQLGSTGDFDVTVFNPFTSYNFSDATSDGSASAPQTFSVVNPTPSLDAQSLPAITALTAGNLTITGTNFVPGAKVHILWTDAGTDGGSHDHDVTFTPQASDLTSTSIKVSFDNDDIIGGGSISGSGNAKVEVHNPTPGGGTSNQLDLTIYNPTPAILATYGANSTTDHGFVGDGDTTIDVYGNNFVPGAVVKFGTLASQVSSTTGLATTFVDQHHLTTTLLSDAFDYQGLAYLLVTNPDPVPNSGDEDSDTFDFNVYDPTPVVSSVSPDLVAPDTTFTLTVNGSGFVNGDSDIYFNGTPLNGIDYSQVPNQLSVSVDSGVNTLTGDIPVYVSNAFGQTGAESSNTDKTIGVGVSPTVSSISPDTVCQNSSDFRLVVNGSDFVNGSMIVLQQGANSYVITPDSTGPTQLTATLQTNLVTNAGAAKIWVHNPSPPDNLISAKQDFTIAAPGSNTLFDVDNHGDDDTPGTLRQTVAIACSGDSIHVANGSVTLTQTDPIVIDKDLTIDGMTEGYYTVKGTGSSDTMFDIKSGAHVTFDTLALETGGVEIESGANVTFTYAHPDDAPIHINDADVEIDNSGFNSSPLHIENGATVTIEDNSDFNNSPIHAESGADVTVTNTSFENASDSAIHNEGSLNISKSQFSNNGDSSINGGAIRNSGTLTADFMEFKNGLADKGGAVYNTSNNATITNSAFENNSASKGGGAYNTGTLKIVNLTFYDTTANEGAGVYNESGTSKLNFVISADTHSGPLLSGHGFEIKNSVFGDSSTCDSGNFDGDFSGVNFGDDTNCGTTFTGTSAAAAIVGSFSHNNVLYFSVDPSGAAQDSAVDCTDTDGNNVDYSVDGSGRPSDAACEPGPAENTSA